MDWHFFVAFISQPWRYCTHLKVDIYTIRDIREGDDVDVVGGILRRRRDGRRFHETRETLTGHSIHGVVDKITNGDGRACVWVERVHITNINVCRCGYCGDGDSPDGAGDGSHR